MTVIQAAAVQNCATADRAHNLQTLSRLVGEAAKGGAQLVATPEFGVAYGLDDNDIQIDPHVEDAHPALRHLRGVADEHKIWLLAGTMGISAPDGRTFNRNFLIAPDGTIAARYDKVHLFDVDLAGGESYRESDAIAPGHTTTVADLLGTRLGMTVCYDVRFAYLYRSLAHQGAAIMSVPAAFARKTGQAHWHVLLRARAIETGSFVIAPCQCGEQPDGRLKRYGHSLIIGPWGQVLAEGDPLAEGVISASLDLDEVARARQMVPSLQHDRELDRPDRIAAE